MTSTCICGSVTITIDARPAFIHDCNCSLCRKTGAAWGYFPSASVSITSSATAAYEREDRAEPMVAIHSCGRCGATTHFTASTSYARSHPEVDQIGVNMKLFDPDDLAGVELRFPDGKGWSGEGPFGYRRDPLTISSNMRW